MVFLVGKRVSANGTVKRVLPHAERMFSLDAALTSIDKAATSPTILSAMIIENDVRRDDGRGVL